MEINMPVLAGSISTIMFVLGALPMLYKAFRTKEMASYSLSHILLTNGGNLIHAVYVFSLPPGPIWFMHSFWMISTMLMLAWYVRYEWRPNVSLRRPASPDCLDDRWTPGSADVVAAGC